MLHTFLVEVGIRVLGGQEARMVYVGRRGLKVYGFRVIGFRDLG